MLSLPRRARPLGLLLLSLWPAAASGQAMSDTSLQITALLPNGSLSSPTTMAFLGPNDFLVLEKALGRVRRVLGGVLQTTIALDVNVHSSSERGMLGIAIDPGSPPRVFLYFTEVAGADTADDLIAPLGNRVYRYDWNAATGTLINGTMILDLPATPGPNHDGGVLVWDDVAGHLYAVIGDLNRNGQMQNNPGGAAADDTGVILRVNADGTPAAGNPFTPYCSVTTTQTCSSNAGCPGGETCRTAVARYYAYGVRNCFGMSRDPVGGALWMTENGPGDFDEINRVAPGFNSGWNEIHGPDSRDPQGLGDLFNMPGAGVTYSDPEFSWLNTIAPTGVTFPIGSSWGPAYDGTVLVGDNNFSNIYAMPLNGARDGFVLGGGLADLVADDSTERNLLRIGQNFGVVTDLERGPETNPHIYVVSYGRGTVYRIAGPQADLAITKTDGRTSVLPGQSLTYTIVVSNAGPNPVTGATVADTLPAALLGATWSCTASPGSSCGAGGPGNINDSVGLLVGGTATYTVTGTVSPAASGSLVNTATVGGGAPSDPNPANNAATDTDSISALPNLTIADVTLTEGQSGTATATFTVTLSPASDVQATVNYSTANVTAMAGSDYASASGMLTFAPFETSKPVSVTVNGDTMFEPDETFQVLLSAPSLAAIADGIGLGTILNDDMAPARVFVSVTGADGNDCANVQTPCRTLDGAMAQVATDGEVIVTRSGSYAGATVTKGVRIHAAPGVVAFSGQPITVNAPGARVVLRGLTSKAVTPGTGTGVLIQSAAAVLLENLTVDGWDVGIRQQGAAEAFLKDSTVRNNGTGLRVTTGKTTVDATRFANNDAGLAAESAEVSLRGSTLSGNTTAGVSAASGSSVTIEKCQLTNNGTGVTLPAASASTVRLSRSVVSGNGLGLENVDATLEVSGNNAIRGNVTDTSGTITFTPLK